MACFKPSDASSFGVAQDNPRKVNFQNDVSKMALVQRVANWLTPSMLTTPKLLVVTPTIYLKFHLQTTFEDKSLRC